MALAFEQGGLFTHCLYALDVIPAEERLLVERVALEQDLVVFLHLDGELVLFVVELDLQVLEQLVRLEVELLED